MKRKISAMTLALLTAVFTLLSTNALAQYIQTNLVSNQPGVAHVQDPNLINGWGLTRATASPFWVSDNVTGKSTLSNGSAAIQTPLVTIPPPPADATHTPTCP